MIDLAKAGFACDHICYRTLIGDPEGVVLEGFGGYAERFLLKPLARFARDRVAISAIEPDDDDMGVRFRVGATDVHVTVPAAEPGDLEMIDILVGAINDALGKEGIGHAFALVVPKPYELRGVLLPAGVLARLADEPTIRAPIDRSAWRAARADKR